MIASTIHSPANNIISFFFMAEFTYSIVYMYHIYLLLLVDETDPAWRVLVALGGGRR
jgi:hypothetical protein